MEVSEKVMSMKTSLKSTILRTTSALCAPFKKTADRYGRDENGVAAIEFAFIAPAMLFMYFGLLEISLTVGADRQVSHSTNVAGDLVSQVSTVSKADMEDVLEATLAVMNIKAKNRGNVTIEISSYQMLNDASKTRERIGYARLGPPISKGGPATFDPMAIGGRMIKVDSGAIVGRVNYKHKMVTAEYFGDITLHETFILKPRASDVVPFSEGAANHNTFMCTAAANLTVSCSASST